MDVLTLFIMIIELIIFKIMLNYHGNLQYKVLNQYDDSNNYSANDNKRADLRKSRRNDLF